jgi:hypothetical protein
MPDCAASRVSRARRPRRDLSRSVAIRKITRHLCEKLSFAHTTVRAMRNEFIENSWCVQALCCTRFARA